MRRARVDRVTNETQIELELDLNGGELKQVNGGSGSGQTIHVSTAIGFLDHVWAMTLIRAKANNK